MQIWKSLYRIGRRRRALVASVLAGSLAIVPLAGAGASTKASVAHKTVAPDLSYYRGKSIDWYVYGAAGSTDDVQARTLAPYVAAYLHASVNIVDAATTESLITGQNIPAGQAPNGLTIGTLDTLADVSNFVTNTPGLEFSLRTVPLLASLPQAGQYVMSFVGLGPTSFKAMVDSTTPISALALAGGSVTLLQQLLYGAYKIPMKYIYGYSTGDALVQGLARGDGDTCYFTLTAFESLLPAGKINVLLQSAKPVKGIPGYSYLTSVPTLQKFATQDPPKTADAKKELQVSEDLMPLGSIYFAPPGTPGKYVSALNAGLTYALTRKGLAAELIQKGLTPGLYTSAQAKTAIDAAIKDQPDLTRWLAAAAAQ